MQVSKYTPSPMWNEKVSIWSGREHIFQMVLVSGDFLKHTVWFSFNGVLQEREKGVHLAWVAAQVSCWDLMLPPSGQRSVGQNNDIITTTATWWKLGRLWWLSQMVRLTVNHGEMRGWQTYCCLYAWQVYHSLSPCLYFVFNYKWEINHYIEKVGWERAAMTRKTPGRIEPGSLQTILACTIFFGGIFIR